MPEDAAVMDAADLDLSTDGADTGDSADSGDSGDSGAEGADSQDGRGEPGDGKATPAGDPRNLVGPDGKLAAPAKALLDKLNQGTDDDRRLAKSLTRALFQADRLKRELPGGFQELKTLKQQIEDLGGFDEWKERGQELEYFNSLDHQYTRGDPKFVDALTETDEGKQALLKLAPALLGKLNELNHEGLFAQQAKAVIGHMQDARIPLALERLLDFLPTDNPAAKQIWSEIAQYLNGLNELAKKSLAPASTQREGQPDARQQELDQRDQQLTMQEWQGDAKAQHQSLYRAAWSKIVGTRKLSDTQKENIGLFYDQALKKLLPQDFKNQIDRYFARRQKDGYLRYRQTILSEQVPKALRQALARAGIGSKPGPKGGTTTQTSGTKPRAAGTAKPDQGFQMVNQKPDFAKVNRNATSAAMWAAGKAVLKDGTKVQFDPRKRAA